MAYVPFEKNKPVISDTGLVVIDDIRNNLMSLRDAIVAGKMFGFDYSFTGGTSAEPTTMLYTSGVEIIKVVQAWDANAPNRITQARYYYSGDSGTGYDFIKRVINTYTSTETDLTSTAWDDTDA